MILGDSGLLDETTKGNVSLKEFNYTWAAMKKSNYCHMASLQKTEGQEEA